MNCGPAKSKYNKLVKCKIWNIHLKKKINYICTLIYVKKKNSMHQTWCENAFPMPWQNFKTLWFIFSAAHLLHFISVLWINYSSRRRQKYYDYWCSNRWGFSSRKRTENSHQNCSSKLQQQLHESRTNISFSKHQLWQRPSSSYYRLDFFNLPLPFSYFHVT